MTSQLTQEEGYIMTKIKEKIMFAEGSDILFRLRKKVSERPLKIKKT